MTACHFIQFLLLLSSCSGVEYRYCTVKPSLLEHLFNILIVVLLRSKGKERLTLPPFILLQYGTADRIERHADRSRIAIYSLPGNILDSIIDDIGSCHGIEVTDTTANGRLKYEDVPLLCQAFIIVCGIKQLVALLKSDEHRCAVYWLVKMELVERAVLCQLIVIAPSEERAYLAEVVNERIVSRGLEGRFSGAFSKSSG